MSSFSPGSVVEREGLVVDVAAPPNIWEMDFNLLSFGLSLEFAIFADAECWSFILEAEM